MSSQSVSVATPWVATPDPAGGGCLQRGGGETLNGTTVSIIAETIIKRSPVSNHIWEHN
jgi:hypothetical protein